MKAYSFDMSWLAAVFKLDYEDNITAFSCSKSHINAKKSKLTYEDYPFIPFPIV